jgi:hypothetical protein
MTKLTKTWQLPPPPKTKEDEWLPVVRVGRLVPFGYEQDPNDPDLLLPIKRELELLKKAKKHLKKYSTREVANWLTRESGRYISHMGLIKRVKIESKRQREATNARLYAEKYKKALEKAEELSNRIGGANTRIVSSGSP